jgi:hypothetical protein
MQIPVEITDDFDIINYANPSGTITAKAAVVECEIKDSGELFPTLYEAPEEKKMKR